MDEAPQEIMQLLAAWGQGEEAALAELMPLLRRTAPHRAQLSAPPHPITPGKPPPSFTKPICGWSTGPNATGRSANTLAHV
ncbi:MAG: hypothetical protein HY011_35645 [Acidobacteria bacterium]|nr:hypothetical protein [Acidobacteriota bacterium]